MTHRYGYAAASGAMDVWGSLGKSAQRRRRAVLLAAMDPVPLPWTVAGSKLPEPAMILSRMFNVFVHYLYCWFTVDSFLY